VTRILKVVAAPAGAAIAMAAAFFLHPRLGARRRAKAGAAVKRESANVAALVGTAIETTPARRLIQRGDDPQLAAVAQLALQVAFGDAAAAVTVRATRGVVTMRGEVEDIDHIDGYEQTLRSVPGVKDVDNLLRLRLIGSARPQVLTA
jgi:hypothetical protein